MKAPTPHPVTMPTAQLLAGLGSTATSETTFDLERFLDGVLQHVPLAHVVAALANVAKVYAYADRESGEVARGDSWLACELYLRQLLAGPDVEVVGER